MPGFVSDGKPTEEPLDAYAQNISNITPSRGDAFGALWSEGPTSMFMRATNRGLQPGASDLDQFALRVADPFHEWDDVEQQAAQQSTTLSAADANKQYAPPGYTITDKPVNSHLAAMLGQQKREQIEREGVLGRYQANTGWPEQLAMGVAASLLDPINLATAFIPGVGEESLLAMVGFRGAEATAPFAARLVARGVSGFSAGAASQAPVTLLKYNLSQEEHDDYTLMSAFSDMASAGGMNAAFHGIGGAIGDLFKARGRALPGTAVDPSLEASLQTRQAAMSSSVAQLVDGREVDTTPLFDADAAAKRSAMAAELARLPEVGPEAQRLGAELQGIMDERLAPGVSAEERDALLERHDQLVQDAPDAVRRDLNVLMRRSILQHELEQIPTTQAPNIPDLAQEQADLYKNGFAQGIPQAEFDQASASIYGEGGVKPRSNHPPMVSRLPESPEVPAPSEPTKTQTPTQVRLADLETQWAAAEEHTSLTPEERDALDISKRGVATAESRADALDQAASCLKEAGI